MTVEGVACSVVVSFAVFGRGCPPCDRCGAPTVEDSFGIVVEHSSCGHESGYCKSCGLFQCMLSDVECGDDFATEFVAWLSARRAERN